MADSNIKPGTPEQLFVPQEWIKAGHELAAQKDEEMYEEEIVAAAAYDEQVEKVLELVIRRYPPTMSREEFDKLRRYIETEHRLEGISVRRAIGRGARQLRQKLDIKTVVD